ncbi:hypothetical protein Hamer_G025637, partial [Homarus americanus]
MRLRVDTLASMKLQPLSLIKKSLKAFASEKIEGVPEESGEEGDKSVMHAHMVQNNLITKEITKCVNKVISRKYLKSSVGHDCSN